jgi:hypothetical protein
MGLCGRRNANNRKKPQTGSQEIEKMHDEQKEKSERNIGEMRKRQEKMADGRRYIIYYTFEKNAGEASTQTGKEGETNQNV